MPTRCRAEVREAGVQLDFDARTADGRTALDVAALGGKWAVYDALAAQGATAVGPGLVPLVLHRPELAAECVRLGARCEPGVLVAGARGGAARRRALRAAADTRRGFPPREEARLGQARTFDLFCSSGAGQGLPNALGATLFLFSSKKHGGAWFSPKHIQNYHTQNTSKTHPKH